MSIKVIINRLITVEKSNETKKNLYACTKIVIKFFFKIVIILNLVLLS